MSSSLFNTDGATFVKKGTVAASFTKSLDLKAEIESYTNAKATAQARTMLRNVYSWTDPQGFQPTIDATIQSIVQNR